MQWENRGWTILPLTAADHAHVCRRDPVGGAPPAATTDPNPARVSTSVCSGLGTSAPLAASQVVAGCGVESRGDGAGRAQEVKVGQGQQEECAGRGGADRNTSRQDQRPAEVRSQVTTRGHANVERLSLCNGKLKVLPFV